MPMRPYTVLSCAISTDGCLDDTSGDRLILSGPEDLDEVDALRAGCDAIGVGAGTVRADNPRLLVRSPSRRAAREAAGRPPHPLRVVFSSRGALDPAARGLARGAPGWRADKQPRVVGADRARADQDRVGGRPQLVHLVQVLGAGQDQALRRGVVQAAVE